MQAAEQKGVVAYSLFVQLCWVGRGLSLDTVSPSREGCCESPDSIPHVCCPFVIHGWMVASGKEKS